VIQEVDIGFEEKPLQWWHEPGSH